VLAFDKAFDWVSLMELSAF